MLQLRSIYILMCLFLIDCYSNAIPVPNSSSSSESDTSTSDGQNTSCVDSFEPNNDIDEPSEILLTQETTEISGKFCDDEDWFIVNLEPGYGLEVDLIFEFENGDIRLDLYEENNSNLIDYSVESGNTESVRTSHSTSEQTLLIRIWGNTSLGNVYTLSIKKLLFTNECGDGICYSETYNTCPQDCLEPICGDRECNGSETYSTCQQDCVYTYCGDNLCNGSETYLNCSFDCSSFCGDNLCDYLLETYATCSQDCLEPMCGDSICSPEESFNSCEQDCPIVCGDGRCDGSETYSTCSSDCEYPYCGDGVCLGAEDSSNCALDCSNGNVCTDDLFESNDTSDTATELIYTNIPLTLCSSDYDWFSIFVPANETLDINIFFTHSYSDIDMSLYEEDGSTFISNSFSASDTENINIGPFMDSRIVKLKIFPFTYSNAGNSYLLTYSISNTAICGDNLCDYLLETYTTCSQDCIEPICGDSICSPEENFSSCEQDCPIVCGDGRCDGSETYSTCSSDCEYPYCGDGVCLGAESLSNCALDCTNGNVCTDDLFESNNTSDTATELIYTNIPLTLCSSDHDWFSIFVPANETLEIDIFFTHSYSDIDMYLYEEDGVTTYISDSFSSSNNESINIGPFMDSRIVKLRIYHYSNVGNSYLLTHSISNTAICGDNLCDLGENHLICLQDCPDTSVCGNNRCELGEDSSCADCTPVSDCGDYPDAILLTDSNIEDFRCYTSFGGDVTMSFLSTDTLYIMNAISIAGNLSISNNEALYHLQGLNSLETIGGSLSIDNNDALASVSALDSVTSVGGDFTIIGNDSLLMCLAEELRDDISEDNILGTPTISANLEGICE